MSPLSKNGRSQMFFKIGVLKNFAIFTGKHLRGSLFLITLQAWKPAALLKIDYNPVSCEYCQIFNNSFFRRTPLVAVFALRLAPEKEMFFIFVYIEIVRKLKYTNDLQSVSSLKSKILYRYLLFLFFAGTSILNIFK